MIINRIYKVFYDLRVREDTNDMYCDKCKIWTDLDIEEHTKKCDTSILSSSATFTSKRKAFKEFNRLTRLGIDCILSNRKIKWFKGWYFENEWHSKDQDYFGILK